MTASNSQIETRTSSPVGEPALVAPGLGALNYVEDEAARTYFDAREHEAYYRAIKHAAPRRDFHSFLVPVGEAFAAAAVKPRNERLVDLIIAAALRAADPCTGWSGAPNDTVGAPKVNAAEAQARDAERLRAVHPVGFELLGLVPPITLVILKQAYRLAALKYHPDKGGSHEHMTIVNEACAIFEEMLYSATAPATSRPHPVQEGHYPSQRIPRCCHDYRCSMGALLFIVALDDWRLDNAFDWLCKLRRPEWTPTAQVLQKSQVILLVPLAAKLAGRLIAANRRVHALEALAIAEDWLRIAAASGLNYEAALASARAIVGGKRSPSVVLNHPAQVENAHRLGVIAREQYLELLQRLAGITTERSLQLTEFVARHGFICPLESDAGTVGKAHLARWIPEPGYLDTRLQKLTDEQQGEYAITFAENPTVNGVRKYLHVRMTSLLESATLAPDSVDISAMERECRFLSSLFDSGDGFCAADALKFLGELSPNQRRERACVLRPLVTAAGLFDHKMLWQIAKAVQAPLEELKRAT